MEVTNLTNLSHHRSKRRIKDLGEVFTPEPYVKEMLQLISAAKWTNESSIFFEPCIGHGNIAVPVIAKRIDSLTRKYKRENLQSVSKRAVAVALNSFWAIDICPLNVEYSRHRILRFVLQYLTTSGIDLTTPANEDYLAHLLCAISWQIHNNEAISSLSDLKSKPTKDSHTTAGVKWIKQNSINRIDFNNSWVTYFLSQTGEDSIPILFERAKRTLEKYGEGRSPSLCKDLAYSRSVLDELYETRQVTLKGTA